MNYQKILCYGDSNTYGYDPRDVFGGQFERNWCRILMESGLSVINYGENGRCIPVRDWEHQLLRQKILSEQPELLVVMLGTNDILVGRSPEQTAERMSFLADSLRVDFPALPVLLLAPPPVNLAEFQPDLEKLAQMYSVIAQKHRLMFANPGEWGLTLCFDGIHLGEEAHAVFAEKLLSILNHE